jgi:hypothetical protein
MGLFSFIKSAGKALGSGDDQEAPSADDPKGTIEEQPN